VASASHWCQVTFSWPSIIRQTRTRTSRPEPVAYRAPTRPLLERPARPVLESVLTDGPETSELIRATKALLLGFALGAVLTRLARRAARA